MRMGKQYKTKHSKNKPMLLSPINFKLFQQRNKSLNYSTLICLLNKMPFYWTSDDTKYASICAAVPASAAIFGTLYAANDAKVVNFLKGQQYPKKLAPSCQFFYLGMNVATVAPFGYASYLVYKIGGGFDYMDTTVALGFYGGTIAASLAMGLPLYYRNVKSLAITNGILAALAMATAVAFYKIDHISGYWAIPFTLWTLYCASVNGKVSGCCNKKVAIE